MLIPLENLLAQPGKMLPIGPLPVVATLAETPNIDRGGTAAAEKDSLLHSGDPGGTDHSPSREDLYRSLLFRRRTSTPTESKTLHGRPES
jgi:hypothetical protein